MQMNEIGFYTLAGDTKNPHDMIQECRDAERLGLGVGFISERLNFKEAATISGGMAVANEKMGIGVAATNSNTRHPMVTAAYASSMHRLSQGRFALGLGRGSDRHFDALGLPRINFKVLEDFAGLMRRLWKGEQIVGHDGPAGKFPFLHLGPDFDEDIPLMMVAIGPKTAAFAGAHMDGVVLHTFFTDETLGRTVHSIRQAAEQNGRDPKKVRVWSVLATIGDHLPYEKKLLKTVGRMATYLQIYGDILVKVNGWDPKVLQAFREDALVASFPGMLDAHASTEQLEHVATLIPQDWLDASATGSPEHCAKRINDQFAQGADGVILHGVSPTDLEEIVPAYAKVRDHTKFDGRSANPGK